MENKYTLTFRKTEISGSVITKTIKISKETYFEAIHCKAGKGSSRKTHVVIDGELISAGSIVHIGKEDVRKDDSHVVRDRTYAESMDIKNNEEHKREHEGATAYAFMLSQLTQGTVSLARSSLLNFPKTSNLREACLDWGCRVNDYLTGKAQDIKLDGFDELCSIIGEDLIEEEAKEMRNPKMRIGISPREVILSIYNKLYC